MATVSKVQAVSNLARANFLIGVSRWEDGRIRDARENLMKVPEEHREFEWHLLMALLANSRDDKLTVGTVITIQC